MSAFDPKRTSSAFRLRVIEKKEVYALSSLPCLIAAQHCESRRGGGSLAILPKASRSMICT